MSPHLKSTILLIPKWLYMTTKQKIPVICLSFVSVI